jgi:type II secretory pathway component PulK
LRQLVTVSSGNARINLNLASVDVITALPEMQPEFVQSILLERRKAPFASADDLVKRVPEMQGSGVLDYLRFDGQLSNVLVSRATVAASGVSRTVRLLFRREEKIQILRLTPFIYRRTEEIQFGRWRYD